jgi:hypothetical protein
MSKARIIGQPYYPDLARARARAREIIGQFCFLVRTGNFARTCASRVKNWRSYKWELETVGDHLCKRQRQRTNSVCRDCYQTPFPRIGRSILHSTARDSEEEEVTIQIFCSRALHSRQSAVPSLDLVAGAQRQRFTSTRQRLKTSGWRGIELGPVELLLNAVKGFFADLAPRSQAVQCRALGGDRA